MEMSTKAATMKKSTALGRLEEALAAKTSIEKPFAGTGSLPPALQVLMSKSMAIAKDPSVQVIALSAGGGAVTLGAAGGACGMTLGGVTGAAVGVVPALFTFGLSIPTGAVLGGAVGTAGGIVIGGGAGIIVGGGAGGITYRYKIEIRSGLVKVQTKVGNAVSTTIVKAKQTGNDVKVHLMGYTQSSQDRASQIITYTQVQAKELADKAWKKSLELKTKGYELATDRTAQVTAASAAAGGVALGATGGIAGLATGGAIGAAIGVIPALFTFGLSIPIGACIGATTGAVAGASAGGTVGMATGGLAGNRLYVKREEIKTRTFAVYDTANNYASIVKGKAQELPGYVQRKMVGSTGTTETED